jgi:hypothetical protein
LYRCGCYINIAGRKPVSRKKPYNKYTNGSHQPNISKHHQTSTTLEDWTRLYALATAIADSLVI